MLATSSNPNRAALYLFKAIILILILAILLLGFMVFRSLLTKNSLDAPRTELERSELSAIQAVKANPNDAKSRIKLAAVYIEKGNTKAAIKEATTATRLDPDNAEGFYVLGLSYKSQGNLNKARTEMVKATKMTGQLAPFYQTCWLEIAKIDNEKKDYKNSIKDYDAALGYGPETTPILYDMGVAYEKAGDKQTALAYYKEALEYVPDYKNAITAIERLAKEGIKLKSETTTNKSESKNIKSKTSTVK